MWLINLSAKLSQFNWLPPLITRFTLAVIFIESGWGKLHRLGQVTEYFSSLGIPAAQIQAPLVSGLEFVCGILILIGLATRFSSLPLIGIMAVANRTTQWENLTKWSSIFGISEFLYIVLLLWLVIDGAGQLSMDFLIRHRKRS